MIRLYLMDIRAIPRERFEELLSPLPESRREKARRYRFEADRLRSLAAGLLARRALENAGLSDDVLEYGETGRPLLAGREDLTLSLSHSGNYAACALGPGPLAVDVQEHEGGHEIIVRHAYTPGEQAYCGAAVSKAERTWRFYEIWCKKECRMKLRQYRYVREIDTDAPEPGLSYRFYPLEGYTLALYGAPELLPEAPELLPPV